MKLKKTSKRSFVGIASCLGVLALVAVAMLCPIRTDSASAEEGDSQVAVSTHASVFVKSMVSVSLNSKVDIEVIPQSTGAWAKSEADLTVTTNNSSGYSVYMATGNGLQSLKATDTTNESVIGPVNANTKPGNFGQNTWGYALTTGSANDNTAYNPVPARSALVKTATTANARDDYKLTFGTFIGTDLPAGEYQNTVTVSVVANPLEITSLSQLTYMQDMRPDICAATTEGVSKQLIDTRDGSLYYVAKLKDGNCWMTQNLALDLSTARSWSSANTNLPEGTTWTPASTTDAVAFTGVAGDTTQTNQFSWGKWKKTVLATPQAAILCNSNRGSDQYNSIISSETLAEVCADSGFVDVSGSEWKPTFQAQTNNDGVYVAVDSVAKTYDPHFLVGNYYQYNAATAGTGGTITSTDASGSVCPKGWELPTSGTGSFNQPGSFAYLLRQYGIATGDNSGSVSAGGNNIAGAPLYFVRSGFVYPPSGYLRDAGKDGLYWSSSVSTSAATAYYLEFRASGVYPSRGPFGRYFGRSVRCLAQ